MRHHLRDQPGGVVLAPRPVPGRGAPGCQVQGGQMRFETTLALALVFCLPTLSASQGTDAERYAREIQLKADSVFDKGMRGYIQVSLAAAESGFEYEEQVAEAGRLLRGVSDELRRLTGDFDVVVPPEALSKVHDRLMEAIQRIASASKVLSDGMVLADGPVPPDLKVALFERLLLINRAYQASLGAYSDERDRAGRMLEPMGASLPPLINPTGGDH